MRVARLVPLVALHAALSSVARAEGTGSEPGTPAFDPTGSHPLPNDSVDGRKGAAEAPRGGACGCALAHRDPGGSPLSLPLLGVMLAGVLRSRARVPLPRGRS